MTKSLVQRLRESANAFDAHMGRDIVVSRDDAELERESADEIERLERENERIREENSALKSTLRRLADDAVSTANNLARIVSQTGYSG